MEGTQTDKNLHGGWTEYVNEMFELSKGLSILELYALRHIIQIYIDEWEEVSE